MKKREKNRRGKEHFALGSVMSKDARVEERRQKPVRKSLDLCKEMLAFNLPILRCRLHKDHGRACQMVLDLEGFRVIVSWYKTK